MMNLNALAANLRGLADGIEKINKDLHDSFEGQSYVSTTEAHIKHIVMNGLVGMRNEGLFREIPDFVVEIQPWGGYQVLIDTQALLKGITDVFSFLSPEIRIR